MQIHDLTVTGEVAHGGQAFPTLPEAIIVGAAKGVTNHKSSIVSMPLSNPGRTTYSMALLVRDDRLYSKSFQVSRYRS